MANVDHISTGAGVFTPIRNFFAGVAESFALSRQFHATYRELDVLSSRELADLGIGRSDIHRIAYDAVYNVQNSEYRAR